MSKKKVLEEAEYIIKRLVFKNVLIPNYGSIDYPKWELAEYYKELIPDLYNYDFFIYHKEAYLAERFILDNKKTKEVFSIVCKTDFLYDEVRSFINKIDICWQCGTELVENKTFHPLVNKGRTSMCESCNKRLDKLFIEYNKAVDEYQFYQNNINRLVKENESSNSSCYIATFVYEDINHPKVESLRKFRDNVLLKFPVGRYFVKMYYRFSPELVRKLKDYDLLKKGIKLILDLFLFLLKKSRQLFYF